MIDPISIESKLDFFESYERGEMKPMEKIKFEEKLKSDMSFSQDYKAYKTTKEIVEEKISLDLKSAMKNWSEDKSLTKDTYIRKINFTKLAIAATLLLCITTFSTQYFKIKNYPDTLITNIITPDLSSTRSSDTENRLATILSDNKDPHILIAKLSLISANEKDYKNAQKLIVEHNIKIGDCQNALRALQNLGEDGQLLTPISEVLCLLKNGNDSALLMSKLDSLLNDKNHVYYQDAVNIKRGIDGFWWKLFH